MDKRRRHFKRVGPRGYTLSWFQKPENDRWSIAQTQLEAGKVSHNVTVNDGWEFCSMRLWTRSSMNILKITFGNGLGLTQHMEHKL